MVKTADGSEIPLGQLATVEKVIGPIQINRENNQRRWVIQANVRGRDLGGVVSDIQKVIKEKIEVGVDVDEDFFGSMEDLMGRGIPLKCTYEELGDDGVLGEVIIYVANDKMHTEMDIEAMGGEGENMKMDMIIDGDWVYIWNDLQAEGMKMKTTEMQGYEDLGEDQEVTDLEEEVNMKCRPWIKDSSKFEIPTEVVFNDMTQMMEDFQDFSYE
jgi:hypothetical protein